MNVIGIPFGNRYSHPNPGHLAQYAETSAIGAALSTKCDTLENPVKKARARI
jgi:hypothetical protein